MDMNDDDFVGDIEFDLTPAQSETVRRAIDLAAAKPEAGFAATNPLIAIMEWWQTNVPAAERQRGSPESTLAEACRLFVLAHEKSQQQQ